MKHVAKVLVAIGVLSTPALAEEPNGYPITDVNLRAGPGTEYPVLVTAPTDAPITILGCLEDYSWCDTVFEEYRGWMRSIYLAGYYDGEYYLLSDYAPDLGYQVVTFDVAAYWDSYYQDEPFYNDRNRGTEARGEGWVDDGVFYDRLSPYGSWTWTQGQYVWVPAGVDASWRPYTRGRWVYTDYGWTWVSDEPFGWATYHYGRWGFSSRIGWFWVPGNRWGPAWVSWRQSDDYLAWAPLPPAYERGLSINISFGATPSYYWSVVPSLYFLSDDLPRYYIRDDHDWRRAYDRTRPIGHTTIINNTVVNKVVNVNYVEQHTNTNVVERKVTRTRDWDRAGKVHGNTFEVYRPGLGEGRGRHAPDDPRKIDEVAEVSKTKALAQGEATTEDLLAPPEVREAIKRRAKGPPPSAAKKAKSRPVPAEDLGVPRERSKGKPRKQTDEVSTDQKPAAKTFPPKHEAKPKRQMAPAQAEQGKPTASEKKARAKHEAKPKQQAPAQAQQQKPKGSKKEGPPKHEAKAKKENARPQAQSNTDSAGREASSGGKANDEKNKGKKKKKKDQ